MRSDCRKFDWPTARVIVADPPWDKPDDYRWAAGMAREKLEPGGLVFVQCGQKDLPELPPFFPAAGLKYEWTLAIVYQGLDQAVMRNKWMAGWRPVLVFSQCGGNPYRPGSDVYTVSGDTARKEYHVWQQPLKPWAYWLARFARPGSLILDPFAGSGTVGVATVQAGENRMYIGTEVDKRTWARDPLRISSIRRDRVPTR